MDVWDWALKRKKKRIHLQTSICLIAEPAGAHNLTSAVAHEIYVTRTIKNNKNNLTNVYYDDIHTGMVTKYSILEECTGFDWDKYNSYKNWSKHNVSMNECEEIFFNQPLIIFDDIRHSDSERRFYSLGKTDRDRKIFIAFTIRRNLIKVISARDITNTEKRKYKRHEK